MLQRLKIYAKPDSFSGGCFRSWLFVLTRHHCLNYLASAHVARRIPLEESPEMAAPQPDSENRLDCEALQQAMARLSEKQQISLKLFYEGFSYEEISGRTGFGVRAVKSYIQNGRERLKRLLTKKS